MRPTIAGLACGLLLTAGLPGAERPNSLLPFPAGAWPTASAASVGLDDALLRQARDYALTGRGSGMIVCRGRAVLSWGDPLRRYDIKSSTKSFGATAAGIALLEGLIDLDDPLVKHHPGALADQQRSQPNLDVAQFQSITLRQLLTQTAGFEKPGGYPPLAWKPGTTWVYSDSGPNWLAEALTLVYRQDVNELMFERLFTPMGITRDDLVWRKNSYRPHQIDGLMRREFGSGISANVNAMARLGLLYLRGGEWEDRRLLSADFVRLAGQSQPEIKHLPVMNVPHYGSASSHYGWLWWNNSDRKLANVPRDAFWSWGLHDSLIVVIPSLDIVVARAGESWQRDDGADPYDALAPFLGPIAQACSQDMASITTPSAPGSHAIGPSPVLLGIDWSPPETIVRRAQGGDNWPITWADDDALYTAYGDGRGFEPFVPKKLSLGLCRVTGGPYDFTGENIPAPSLEAVGDDRRGRKASGLLCIDGALYLLARNCGNSQLAASHDHGRTWDWVDWKFETSFGCPTFLNCGRDYGNAPDGYVYVYSQDADSAYERSDRMVLARVPTEQLLDHSAWEFFVEHDANGGARWSSDVKARGAVFTSPGRCYRSSVCYSAPLQRYLWTQTGLGEDTRFAGGLGLYDAPVPWGPWTRVFETDAWDVGPGETSSLPTKWMTDDGLVVHLVFSGDDSFSVRRGVLRLSHR